LCHSLLKAFMSVGTPALENISEFSAEQNVAIVETDTVLLLLLGIELAPGL